VVATTVNPSAKGNFLTFQAFVQLAAIVAAHHDNGSLLVIRYSVEIPLRSSNAETHACRSFRA